MFVIQVKYDAKHFAFKSVQFPYALVKSVVKLLSFSDVSLLLYFMENSSVCLSVCFGAGKLKGFFDSIKTF